MVETTEFVVETPAGPLTCGLASPAADAAAAEPALLLAFGGARHGVLGPDARNPTVEAFAAAGHRVVSFDLPNHGDLVDQHGESISGMCAAFAAGHDPFARFVDHGVAVIDACLEMGLAAEGRTFVCGVSRGGYCALRLAAADSRVAGVAGIAPVTDWRILQEFSAVKERPEVAALALGNWAADLAGRPVYLAIGDHDHRVGTHACVGLAGRILEHEDPTVAGSSRIELHVVESAGHGLADPWRVEAAHFLLRLCDRSAGEAGSMG